ncbi:hypothetical protein IFM89_039634 [Coptis chinensis]|uniref:inositol-1,3,4-trisphosphate 5/6-kinase n=1 Tax=Coptis chinensis TaxID=261450 RepID=A0A835GUT1_9MAGN|nr:hypothetical protein IFM89_039634 [Coptis chinensis]
MGCVRGILLDESVLFAEEEEEEEENTSNAPNIYFQSGAESLLRRLQFSKIRTGISYGVAVSAQKVTFLQRISMLYSLDSFLLNPSSIDVSLNHILLAWGDIGATSCFYVTSTQDDPLSHQLINHHWSVFTTSSTHDVGDNSKVSSISTLEELPLVICDYNRKASGESVVTVGYVMKPSREEDFAKRGAFPMHPTPNGLLFVPLTFNLPLVSQLQKVDLILHKATDEVVSVGLNNGSGCPSKTSYTKGMQEMERYFQDHHDFCIIDPLDNISPVLDRLSMQHILLGLDNLKTDGHCRIRAPHFLKVDDFNDPNLGDRLSEVNLFLPSIVKPQVACGLLGAHDMAIVFRTEDFKGLRIPLPVVVQEYVDHSSLLYKFYVLGDKVFYAVKNSTPNADVFLSSYEKDGKKPIIFNSLKSLPTSKDDVNSKTNKQQSIDLDLVTKTAKWLRKMLNLTIFGFDVVIQEGSRDHVVVDVNYLPSFKEVADEVAVPAFWDAIKNSYELRKAKVETVSFP